MRPVIAVPFVLCVLGCSQRSTPEEPETGAFNPDDAVHRTDDMIKVAVHRKDVPLQDMPIIAETLGGLPMTGLADLSIDLTVPKAGGVTKYKEISGSIAASCPAGCAVGNGKTQFAMPGAGEVDFGRVDLGAVDIRAVIKAGHLTMNQFDLVSGDFEMHAQLRLDFADALDNSTVDGCIWFKPKDALRVREPKTYTMLSLTGASVDAAGFYSIKLAGTVGGVKRLAQDCRPQT
jgi:type II secretion system protein N